MQKKLIAIAIGFAFVASPAFAGDWMGSNDSGHGGVHDKWKSPGDGPGQGYGHFKDHGDKLGNPGHPDKDKPHGDKPNPGPVNNGGNGGAGGQGGKGGEGGNAQLNAKLSSSAVGVGTGIASSDATGGNAKSASNATGGQGGASNAAAGISGSGNGGGATVGFTDNSTNNVKYVTNVLPEAPSAPLSMAIGNIATTKMGVCGPMFDILENNDAVIQTTPGFIFGIGADYTTVRTMHGLLRGLSKTAFIDQTTGEFDDNGNPIKVVRLWGHQLVMVATVTGTSAGSGVGVSGANSAGAASVGITNGAGAALPGVLVTAMPCVYKAFTVKPVPVPVPVPPTCVKGAKGGCVKTTLAE